MVIVTTAEFRSNLKKYLNIALTEKVALMSNGVIFEITPSTELRTNPSPSNDPYWDDQQNIKEFEKRRDSLKSGETKTISYDELKRNLKL